MPILNTAGNNHKYIVEYQGLIAVSLDDSAQAFGAAAGVFDLDAAAGMDAVVGPLRVGQRHLRILLAASGLAVGQALRDGAVVSDQPAGPAIRHPFPYGGTGVRPVPAHHPARAMAAD